MTSTDYQQLVEFLGRQFSEIDRRFVGIDQRFDEMGGQLAELRRDVLGHFDEIYRRFERLDQEYHAITQALRRIEAVLADERGRREILERDLAQLKKGVAALQARIDEIEQRLGR
jgi:chromosome segregation ATPase